MTQYKKFLQMIFFKFEYMEDKNLYRISHPFEIIIAQDQYTIFAIFSMIFNHYSPVYRVNFEIANKNKDLLKSFFNEENNVKPNSNLYLRKNSKILQILAEDEMWGFSIHTLNCFRNKESSN